jgi:Cu-Zn family superoxide dismutase
VLGAAALAQEVPEGTTEYELPGDAVFPEGIAVHESSGTFFVSGAGSGGIYRVDIATGEATEFVAAGTRPQFTTIGLDVDDRGRLWVAGGGSGEVLVYDVESGEQLATFTTPEADARFLNDVIVTGMGAFVTDSNRPTLWHVPADAVESGGGEAEAWLDFTGTAFEYQEGFNANGIVANEDGSVLLIVSGATGALYRVDVATQEVAAVETGATFEGGDGLVLDGTTLYIVQNGADLVAVVQMSDDLTSGEVTGYIEDERLTDSSTAALVGEDLLVVNTQFSAMRGTPELPFTVSVVPTSQAGAGP